jgi:hypothetical protein
VLTGGNPLRLFVNGGRWQYRVLFFNSSRLDLIHKTGQQSRLAGMTKNRVFLEALSVKVS